MNKLNVIDLFSGIGGFSLGLKRTGGFRTVAMVEIEPYCQKILKARMSDGHLDPCPVWSDVRDFPGGSFAGLADVVVGGFPCQDVSNAYTTHDYGTEEGGLRGLDGERSGLWREFHRVLCEVQPEWAVVENVGALSVRGLCGVLGDLAGSGFDADWATVSASSLGAPHIRKRLFIVARRRLRHAHEMLECADGCDEPFCPWCQIHYSDCAHPGPHSWDEDLQDADCPRLERDVRSIVAQPDTWGQDAYAARSDWGDTPPRICRKSDGVSNRVDRLKALGNSVVPQVVEWIGKQILFRDRPGA